MYVDCMSRNKVDEIMKYAADNTNLDKAEKVVTVCPLLDKLNEIRRLGDYIEAYIPSKVSVDD